MCGLRRAFAMAAVAGCVVWAGCSGSDTGHQPGEVVVRDSAGITIIDNGRLSPADPGEGPPLLLTIGVVEGDSPYELFQVGDVKRLSDGAIAVTNGGTRELRIYAADGTHRATAGGAGQGPGEFRYPTTLVILPGDTIQVQDVLDRAWFTADGDFVRREIGQRQALAERAPGGSEGGQWLADGSYLAPMYQWTQDPPEPGPPFRPPMTLVKLTSDFGSPDTLGLFGGIVQQYVEVGGRFGVAPVVPPFAASTRWSTGSSDGTIIVADNAAPQVDRFHPDGTASIVRWTAEAEPVTSDAVEDWKDQQRDAGWTAGQLPELERGWEQMEVPRVRPYFRDAAMGSDGTVWVAQEDTGEGTPTFMFGSDGRFKNTVRFPRGFKVLDSGPGWVLGLLRDENEVEFIHVYER